MKWAKEKVEELKELREQGFTIKQIARILNTSYKSVETALDRYSIPREREKVKESLKNRIIKLIKQGYTYEEIAERVDLTTSQVKYIIEKYNLKERAIEKIGFLDIEACVTGDTLVLTENGLKYIKDIKVGEKVLTHKNRWKRVVATSKRKCNGVLYNISPFYMPLLNVTPNHPLLVFKFKNKKRSVFDRNLFNSNTFSEPIWIKSKEVQEGDICISIKPDEWVWKNIERVYVGEHPSADRHRSSNIPSYLPVTDDLLIVIGLFLGDGWANEQQVSFFANKKDKEFIEILERWFKSINASFTKKEEGRMICYTHCSKQLGNFFRQFYNEKGEKYLPLQWLNLPDKKFLKIIQGLILSDGVKYKYKDAIFNTSEQLLREIVVRLMFIDSVSVRAYKYKNESEINGYKSKKPCYLLTVSHYNLEKNKHRRRWKVLDYFLYKIVRKEKIESTEYVYNLQIEDDESYIANGIISHNSNFQADFGIVFSYCIKELGGELIANVIKPKEIRNGSYDKRLIKEFIEDLKKFDRIVGYYAKKFDIPFLRARTVYYNLRFPPYGTHFFNDVYYLVKNRLQLHRNRLEDACRYFDIPCKTHPLVPTIWLKAMKGDRKALDYILEHNKEDVLSLEALWKKIYMYGLIGRRSI